MKTIAITGATGFLGGELVKHFSAKGDRVIAVVRNIPRNKIAGIDYVLFDLSTGKCSQQKIGADVLIHTAYVAVTESKNALAEKLDGQKALLALFPGRTKKIFISGVLAAPASPAVYGQQKAAVEKFFID